MRAPLVDLQPSFSMLSVKELERHRLLGFAFSRGWTKVRGNLRAEAQFRANLKREAYLQGLVRSISDHPMASNIRIGLLKGPALWNDLYRPGERECADLDLYVAEIDRALLLKILSDCGFHPSASAVGFKTLCLNRASQNVSVEVHTRLWRHEPEDFLWHWRPALQNGFSRLTAEDQFIHLCGHWAAQHTMISLHWLFDIMLFLKQNPHVGERHQTKERARRLRLGKSVHLASLITQKLMQETVLDERHDKRPGQFRTGLVDLEFLKDPRRQFWRYFLVKHAVQDRLTDAAFYDLKWFGLMLSSRISRVFPKSR